MRIVVTGGSGKLGRSVVQRLTDEGHEVLNLDRAGEKSPRLVLIDLKDYGQVVDAILGIDDRHTGLDAIVHLGAIPAPGLVPDVATFHNNMLSTYLQRFPGRPSCRHQEAGVRLQRDRS